MVVQEISRRDGISLPISPMDSINSWHTSPESGSNPGIDRPNARYNSALWLRAASPEKKRNANPMAGEGRRVKAGKSEETGGGIRSKIFRPSIPLPFVQSSAVACIQREGKLRRAASRSRSTTLRPYPAYDSGRFSQERARLLPKERSPPL